jgi:hypothetical protein
MIMNWKMLVPVCCLWLSGCFLERPAQFAPTHADFVPSTMTRPEDIALYRTEKPVQPYEEIGTVYFPNTNLTYASEQMKKKAAHNGGDAIIDIKVTSDGTMGTVVRFLAVKKGGGAGR